MRWEHFKATHPDFIDFIAFAGSVGGILSVVFAFLPASPLVYLLAMSSTVIPLVGHDAYYILIGFSVLAWVITFLLSVRYAASKQQLRAATKSISEILQHSELAEKRFTAIALERDSLIHEKENFIIILTRIFTRFFEIALANAECDKTMFDIFLADIAEKPLPS